MFLTGDGGGGLVALAHGASLSILAPEPWSWYTSLSHTHTLSLSLLHTHTHNLPLFHTHTLSLSLTHTLSLSHTYTHTLTHPRGTAGAGGGKGRRFVAQWAVLEEVCLPPKPQKLTNYRGT